MRILPTHVRILPGRRENSSAAIKNASVNREEIQLHIAVLGKDLFQTDGKGNGGAAGNGEEWPDGEIQRAGEEIGIGTVHLAAERKQAVTAGKPQRRNAQKRQSHAGNEQTKNGTPHIAAGQLTDCGGENQVAGAEE